MRVRIVTHAPRDSRVGNRVTARRWARLLRGLGHRVTIAPPGVETPCDVVVALHARRSAAAVLRSKRLHPARPVVVALTGTDLYLDLARSPRARAAVALADRLVVLQDRAPDALPAAMRAKTRVIRQSLGRPRVARRSPRPPTRRGIRVAVLGHLRPVKDPLRAALALRRLPRDARVEVVHAGAALSPAMARRARAEAARNPRYRWVGSLPRARALRLLAGSDVLVLSSRAEGGANVLGEAIVLGVPVLVSRIPGALGVVGARYPGTFRVGDTAGLARLLARFAADRGFRARLARACRALRPCFRPAREARAWRTLLREVRSGARSPQRRSSP